MKTCILVVKMEDGRDACAEAIFGRQNKILTETVVHKTTNQFFNQRDNTTLYVP